MIYITTQGQILRNGLNIVAINDGGFSLKFKLNNHCWIFRVRGKDNQAKPRFLFSHLEASKNDLSKMWD